MHLADFLQDLAIIMMVAGLVTIIFHQLKQPVVLGYILSGVILGHHILPFSPLQNEETIKTLAELGVIFLMFSLGLEFNLRKLFRVGGPAALAAIGEIVFMVAVGYEIGRFFGWHALDSLFLGATLAISSTTIIIKALDELGMKREKFAQLIFGILIIEDVLAIAMLVLLSGIAVSGDIEVVTIFSTLGKLLLFLVVSLVLGILTVPRLLAYVAKFHSREMLLISVLGLCFGFCLLVIQLDYSVALGAFVIGAIMAESREIKLIEQLVEPLTNMFSAIFFVTIGLLVDPTVMVEYAYPILIISLAVIIGKVLTCGAGVFLAGRDGRTALRVGMGLAQIGEFSFIIASLGVSLKVTSSFLYPIIVAVSAITTLTTPYLIKVADPLSLALARHMPKGINQVFSLYTTWLQNIRPTNQSMLTVAIRKALLQIFINLLFIAGIFITGSYLAHSFTNPLWHIENQQVRFALIWGIALIVSLPFLIAIYLKTKALGMIFAEMAVRPEKEGQYTERLRRIIAEIIPVISTLGVLLLLFALSASILPSSDLLILVLVLAILVAAFLWRWFIKLHSRVQAAFIEQFKAKDADKKDIPSK